jgi:hypothetical protein
MRGTGDGLLAGEGNRARSRLRSGAIIPVMLLIPNVARMLFPAPALLVMAVALAVYYAAWFRYFAGGGAPDLLSAPLAGIPSPLAHAPNVLLAVSSYVLASRLMLGAALCFGGLHVWASALGR